MSLDSKKRSKWADAFKGQTAGVDKRVGGQSPRGIVSSPRGTPVPPRGLIPVTNSYSPGRFALTADLAFFLASSGASVSNKDVYAFVYTPSTRLTARINVFFEPSVAGTTPDPTFNGAAAPTWAITNMARHPISGYESPLKDVLATTTLPDEFTIQNAGELLRVKVTLSSNQFKLAYVPLPADCACHMVVTWEPNTPITPDELKRLYEACKISTGQVFQIALASIP